MFGGPLVEKAGYKMEDIPKTWDADYDFFEEVQKKLRDQRMCNIFGFGFQLTTNGNDPNEGERSCHEGAELSDYLLQGGFVPPGAINWNDADDNNAFHAKTIVMDLDGTISTEVAIINNKQDYDDIVVMDPPLGNDGKPVPLKRRTPVR